VPSLPLPWCVASLRSEIHRTSSVASLTPSPLGFQSVK
jgi:hypothetical protein